MYSVLYLDDFLGPEHIQKTTFASMNQYFNDKSIIFLTKVNFDNFKETSCCHIFKMVIFSKFFGDLITYIIREYAGKKMK